jgi:hypothetical protein
VNTANSRRCAGALRLTTLLAIAGLGALSAYAQGTGGGGTGTGGNGLGGQRDSTRPKDVKARPFQPAIGAPGAFFKIGWSRPGNVPGNYILGYVIRRSSFSTGQSVVGGLFGDVRNFVDSEAGRTVSAYDGDPASDDAGAPADFTVTGIVPGQFFAYQVSSAYRNGLQDRDNTGTPDGTLEFMSPLSNNSGYIMAVGPPTIAAINGSSGSGQQVDVSQIQVDWQQSPGTDTYVLWISKTPNFKNHVEVKLGKAVPVDLGGDSIVSKVVNASSKKLRGATNLFLSVGGRRGGDPKPVPFGAMFSAPVQVQVLTTPPPPPGSSSASSNAKKGKGK